MIMVLVGVDRDARVADDETALGQNRRSLFAKRGKVKKHHHEKIPTIMKKTGKYLLYNKIIIIFA